MLPNYVSRQLLIIITISAMTGVYAATSECIHTDTAFKCVKYVSNYDGDTITFDIPEVHPLLGKGAKVRVNGVDTPEVKGSNDCEIVAAKIAKRLIESELKQAQRIDLANVRKDKYFRILADVLYDGKSLREVLLKNKMAVPYDGDAKTSIDWCAVPNSRISK